MTLSASRALWPAPFLDQRGNRRPGLAITVYEFGTGPAPDGDGSLVLAELFVDDALTVPGPNPVTTDADGNETSILAAPGYYDAYVDGETIRILVVDPSAAGDAAAVAADLAALEAELPDIYAPIAEVAARIAGDDALDARIDALETGGGYDPNAVTVLRFTGATACHVNHGPYWPLDEDLGHFYWDAWTVNDNGYLISDGNGGGHCLLWGGLRSGSTVSVTGNIWPDTTPVATKALASNVVTLTTTAPHGLTAGGQVTVNGEGSPFDGTYTVATVANPTTLTYARTAANVSPTTGAGSVFDGAVLLTTFGADDTTAQTEWAHHAVGWDGAFVYYWVDGICSGVTPYAKRRRAQYGELFVGGSDHQNFAGKLAQLRGFEDSFPTTAPRLGFVPERYLSRFDQLGNTAAFLAPYTVPGQLIIADLSDGYNGRVHPGAIHAGPDISGHIAISSGAFGGVPEVAGRPSWVVDPTAPFDVAAAVVPTGAIASVPALPAGADTYDSYNRAKQNNNMVAPTLGTTDARASLGAQTWLYGLTGDTRESRWGIINGCAVCLFAQGGAREIAWVQRTAAGAGMDVRVDRRPNAQYGTHDTGLAIRVASNTDHYAVVTRSDLPPLAAVVDVWLDLAGTLTNLTPSGFTCPTTAWRTLRAVMPTGSTTLTVYVDNLAGGWTQIGQLTGLTNHSTAKGAGSANYQQSTLVRHDNFTVLAA